MNKLVTRLTSAAAACLVVVAGVAVAQNDPAGQGTAGPDTGATPTLPNTSNTMPVAPSGTTTTDSSTTSTPSTTTPSTTPSTGATGTSSYDSGTTTTDSSLPARSDRN
ncbi:MAG TPA: hypothetical protein VFY73_19570 [Ideonella sp.]|uniref:hypothetical protein n=1 Tax=Ideonella sp. TaxID=1929293 RepID=UPI002E3418A4|nr:hypothetical protein [Ideonella sp.]HEX5686234.1 hypothetical protein [Ideonella sp.]